MDFKDAYKSANDKICGDRSLISKVMDKAEKKPIIYFKPAYVAGIAAVAAAMIFTFALYPDSEPGSVPETQVSLDSNLEKPEIDKKVTEIAPTGQTGQIVNDVSSARSPADIPEDIPPEPSVPKAAEAPKAKAVIPEYVPEQKEVAMDKADSLPGVTDIMMEDIHESEIPSEEFQISLSINTDVQEPATFARGGGGSGASAPLQEEDVSVVNEAATADATKESEEVSVPAEPVYTSLTAEQYSQYLGRDIVKTAKLPQDMNFKEPAGVGIEKDPVSGAVTHDLVAYYAESTADRERSVCVYTTRLHGEAEEYINNSSYEKSDICGFSGVIIADEESYRAYVKSSYGAVTVFSCKITEEELKTLLVSLV